jgi:2,4-dienoyl-CoA reductase-like NADH-dependent reductase (Old Yellow Enzyme family)
MQDVLPSSLNFACGATMKNRFMLAPMTNTQSHKDGRLSDEEFHWLTMRAKGQFGLVMTCASHVQEIGQGFPGQLGIFGDQHIEGHQRLATAIKKEGSLAVVQLHHAGMRSPADLIGEAPVCPSPKEKYGARGLSLSEVHQLRDDFINAAIRAQKSAYDGVEVHGAHGYILTQFLSPEINQRTDEYGGNLDNRARLLFEVVDGIRAACGRDFLLGVRLSPERFGMKLQEIKELCQRFVQEGKIDFLDLSLWDCFKLPEEDAFKNKSLLEHFAELDYQQVRWTVAGKIKNGEDVRKVVDAGVDFVSIGRSAILHHDFPVKVMSDPQLCADSHSRFCILSEAEGLSDKFVDYMRRWPNFVE